MSGVPGVAFGDRVLVRDRHGRRRTGQVIRSGRDVVLVQVFEGTEDLDLENTWVRFLDEPFRMAVTREMLGRVFNGIGEPQDDRPPLISADRRSVNGAPTNPAARAYPREFMQTGISAIDGLNSLVRGQKLPIFSGSGLPTTDWRRRSCARPSCRARNRASPWCSPPWVSPTVMPVSIRKSSRPAGCWATW